MVGVLGVVFGDIGTSPLYALRAALVHFASDGLERWEILGVLSLIVWSIIIVVTVKYVLIVLRADNRGEGGILALMALAQRAVGTERGRHIVALIGIAGACLFFGDGIITPAISVLSAVEGLKVISPTFGEIVVPVSLAVLIGLFLVQYRGTHAMGRIFGPVMVLWFGLIGLLGLVEILREPGVLEALSPHHAIQFCIAYRLAAFIALGSVVLAVTGAEALYADMGHFGKRPIRLAWLYFVLPSLILNYLGQGALVLNNTEALENPFFLLAPDWMRLPMVVLATLATIIASQAMISGAFSIARQCVQLGLLPRLVVKHTSETEEGQIYVPQVNFSLLAGVVVLVVAFRNSDSLAAAYGIAVTGTFLATSCLAGIVFHRNFRWSWPLVVAVFLPLFLLDLAFFISNVLKVPDGGWVPLLLGAALYTQMLTWRRGRELLFRRFQQDSLPLKSFLARLPQSRTIRVPGIAIFMTGQADYVPNALLHNLKHNKVLHERIVFVTVLNEDVPQVRNRGSAEELGPGIYRVLLRYGFLESPNIPRDLEMMHETMGVPFEPMQASYFLGRETVVAASVPKMPGWQQWLFTLMSRNSLPATEFFRIPSDRVVELGARVAI
ncbi:Kup system potassium uptake protein [Roseomonas mucosa]|uniref:Probable potassium transport system protein Kup n=1 Tax=Roseomonas mucosa TaxID=207340 RepID=A0A379MWM8_9PROT|nr:Kup system potassium uptake protein [Roseomonas mucosa]QDD98130.1 Kup system potassium uptake protein [Roseomonas mucosa]QDJ07789.1 Kup system potassium uptake protein [Roseomonas mucosa]GAV33091.1 potassium transport protein Kup [Roseomonas sp. TAS13]SUE38966.1 potassium transport protein Kup [Roseomonas mucosa]